MADARGAGRRAAGEVPWPGHQAHRRWVRLSAGRSEISWDSDRANLGETYWISPLNDRREIASTARDARESPLVPLALTSPHLKPDALRICFSTRSSVGKAQLHSPHSMHSTPFWTPRSCATTGLAPLVRPGCTPKSRSPRRRREKAGRTGATRDISTAASSRTRAVPCRGSQDRAPPLGVLGPSDLGSGPGRSPREHGGVDEAPEWYGAESGSVGRAVPRAPSHRDLSLGSCRAFLCRGLTDWTAIVLGGTESTPSQTQGRHPRPLLRIALTAGSSPPGLFTWPPKICPLARTRGESRFRVLSHSASRSRLESNSPALVVAVLASPTWPSIAPTLSDPVGVGGLDHRLNRLPDAQPNATR
ncbi:unnamed protein product [Diplocarpon coronariae]|uniref:Uncharacterized protein n=1 Tax=Diplocarpon coronariae TaxID=2795749 RepID=A0A218Z7V1_9HELO|nr:hypothetical protein B2J93_5968 [Marssonina coronariae]